MARLRGAPSIPAVPASTQTRQALKEKTNTTRSKAPIHASDELMNKVVKDARPKRGRAKDAPQNAPAELAMAGGLGLEHAEPERPSLLQTGHPATTDEFVKSDASTVPAAKAMRRPPRMTRKAVQTEAKSDVLKDVRSRMGGTSSTEAATEKAPTSRAAKASTAVWSTAQNKPPSSTTRKSAASNQERSEFSLSPSPEPQQEAKNSSTKKHPRSSLPQPTSALKPSGTPSLETSILNLKNFKRRPRQPSMLQMVQQLNASARPSAIHVPADEDPSIFDVEDVEDDEEFAPDAAGTPLYANKAKMGMFAGAKDVSQSKQQTLEISSAPTTRKRKSDEADLPTSTADVSRTKRQRSAAATGDTEDVPQIISSRRSSSQHQAPSLPRAPSEGEEIIPLSSPLLSPAKELPELDPANEDDEPRVTSTANRSPRPTRHIPISNPAEDFMDGTMAEPISSSPLPSPRDMSKQNHAAPDSPIEASPAGKRGRSKKSTKSKPITTATLQSLLPKRRQPLRPRQKKSEYDFESDSGDDRPAANTLEAGSEDETAGKTQRRTKSLAPNKGKKSTTTQSKTKSRQSKAVTTTANTLAKSTRKSTSKTPGPASKSTRTYARASTKKSAGATTSDKENAPFDTPLSDNEDDSALLPDTSLTLPEAEEVQSTELAAARRKFAEVDDWDLEFESMSQEGEEGRRSSQNWR